MFAKKKTKVAETQGKQRRKQKLLLMAGKLNIWQEIKAGKCWLLAISQASHLTHKAQEIETHVYETAVLQVLLCGFLAFRT
jgi:hypothetical protein